METRNGRDGEDISAKEAANAGAPRLSGGDEAATKGPLRLFLGAALAFYALFLWRTSFVAQGTRWFVLFEDAMISMRYARNFSRGDGLTWNVGEAPVEGYTNLLWTLWMSALHKLGLPESKISLGIMFTGVAILVTLGFVVARIARKLSDAPWVPVAAAAATWFCYPLVFWTLRGMEVGAVSLCITGLLAFALEIEDDHSWGKVAGMAALGGASALLRSDSVTSVAMLGLYAAAVSPKGRRFVTLAMVGGFSGAMLGAQIAYRGHYYHEKLPNTAHLKLGGISTPTRVKRGLFVMLQVFGYHLGVPFATLITGLLSGLVSKDYKDKTNRRLLLLLAMLGLQFAYAIYVGGDAWEWMLYANRYTSAAMPAVILLVTVFVARFLDVWAHEEERKATVRRFATSLVGIGLLLLALMVFAKVRPEEGIARTIVFSKKVAGFGGLFFLVGLLMFLVTPNLENLVDDGKIGLGKMRERVPLGVVTLILVVLWAPGQLEPLATWAKGNAAQFHDEERYARLGILLNRKTPKDFRIAVMAAGATPYFADRPTEDMLGKNDAVIAKQSPKGVFSPGHDKWDYDHSLREKQSKLIVELADRTDKDMANIRAWGFTKLGKPEDEDAMWIHESALQYAPVFDSEWDTRDGLDAVLGK
jgi:hypothetical protein